MDILSKRIVFLVIFVYSCIVAVSQGFNVGSAGAKVFSEPKEEEFGYSVQQFSNHLGKWLLVGAPWSGYTPNRMGDVYKCEIRGASSGCQKLGLQNSISIPTVKNIKVNMSLGLTLTASPTADKLLTCGPLWAQQCGSQNYYPGVCAEVNQLFQSLPAFSPALQTCGGPMDIAIILDGSNSIYPWPPVVAFLKKLLENLDIGPENTQVAVIQYAVNASFEFYLNSYKTKASIVTASSSIKQKSGSMTNTFQAIDFAREHAFLPQYGGRPGASKVMVVVTDGESHDYSQRNGVIGRCEADKITRFGIAVLGYYIRNGINTKDLITEIKSIASTPSERYFFNVSSEEVLQEISGTLGDRIFNIEGTGKGLDFQMELSQVGFSAHYTKQKDSLMLGAVGAYGWSGTVVHHTPQKSNIFPKTAFENILQDKNHSSLLGYSVTTLSDGRMEYYVAGAPRSNHTGQVVVYTLTSGGQPAVVDSQRGEQIGSYYGSVLCPLDVDRDGVSDLLLVGAPMFMNQQKKEMGKVYLLSFTKGVLSDQGVLKGPSPLENSRFGMAIAAVSDLNLDGYSDVVVGAPLEDSNRGVIYVFNGDNSRTLKTQYSQRILGSKLDSGLRYFGRSLSTSTDLNDDTIPDVTVGAYGKVVQLWSRGVSVVTASVTFDPDKISILSKTCNVAGRIAFCFNAKVCFSGIFKPSPPVGPLALSCNLTLDADLQSSRVTSRGLFSSNVERLLQQDISLTTGGHCETHQVFVQEAPDFVNSLGLRVDVALQNPDANPVLDPFSTSAWEFSIPFSKDCGSDEVCNSDLTLAVVRGDQVPSSSEMLVSYKNKRLFFHVTLSNRKENAYNARVTTTYSKNLFYSSVTPPSDGTEVKCTSVKDSSSLVCQVGYPALRVDQEVTFEISFDFNFALLQNKATVDFEASSDSREVKPSDNQVSLSIPVRYDSEIALSREADPNFYVVDSDKEVISPVKSFSDIGPEFKFSLKVSTGNLPISLAYLTVSMPLKTAAGNPLLYVTNIHTAPSGDVNCDVTGLVDPLKISSLRGHTPSFSSENLLSTPQLDCTSATCQPMQCVLKDMGPKRDFFVNVTSRIWNGTFAAATFQSLVLTVTTEIKTSQSDLLFIAHKQLQVGVTLSKPGEKGQVPVGVIVGSVIGGLLLLAAAIATLWKVGFFKRKYKQLQKSPEEEGETQGLREGEDAP
ncbi:integrin alpha-2 isoform X1 [Osmerus mordax]|uniref:integrin alpha-2 isoform X1 n=2 Tax=Osmerus mordax TaxID=8014 RepID=UPI00350F4FD9